jgi:serine/threonine protein kinase
MDPVAPGRQIGKYRVVRRLAVGGMAEIYLAEARGIEGFTKHVVLKRILPQFAQSETFVRLFLNEARVSATLDHPNIATVYDIGEADGVYFFTMEYLHGEDLGHLLREMVARQTRLPLEHALTIGVGVAAGLHAAHEKRSPDGKPLGIVHRDVSPSNVVVTYDGGVKLCDFGVAKITSQAELTSTGTLKGKVSYMSPEQCNNESLDRRSDVFALGVLLYELSTQTRLFKGDSEAATLKMVLDAEIAPPSSRVPNYPADLEATILKALHRDRQDRYATARELQIALEEVARAHGLITSAASLGAFMISSFGTKVEPWLMPPEEEEAQGDSPADPQGRLTTLDRGPVLRTLVLEDRASTKRSLLAKAWVAGVAVLLLAVATATGLAIERAKATALATAPAGAAAGATPHPAGLPTPLARAARGTVVATAPTKAIPAPSRTSSGRRSSGPPALAQSRPERFSETFARKEPALLRCFAAYPGEASGAPEISVRFRVGLEGEVLSADVLPKALAGTALGGCVEGVARGTRFGRQTEPVTLRIPVSVRRVSGDRQR